MANTTKYGNPYFADTIGMICRDTVMVTAITMIPTAVSDAGTFTFWLPQEKEATSGTTFGTAITGAISSSDTLTLNSGTKLPSTIAVGDFFAITFSNGAAANWNKKDLKDKVHVVKTAGNNTAVSVADDPWTDEDSSVTTKNYTWTVYTGLVAFKFLQPTVTNTFESKHICFPGGVILPNLALASLTGTPSFLIYTS